MVEKKLHLCLNLRLRNQGPNRLEFFKVPYQDNNNYYLFQFEQLRGAVTVAFTLYALFINWPFFELLIAACWLSRATGSQNGF